MTVEQHIDSNSFADVTVVIPTLGGSQIETTIQYLNSGELPPKEILLCLPQEYVKRVEHLVLDNVQVVACPEKGQVAQRAYGFSKAKNDLVLQLDDDIHVRFDTLSKLVATIRGNKKAAIGPKMHDANTGEYRSFLQATDGKIHMYQKVVGWIVNGRMGFKPGIITKSGVNIGLPENYSESKVEWLPGGCILHWRSNLCLNDFYPFDGKAFAEDLFHSHILTFEGITLIRSNTASVDVLFGEPVQSISEHIKAMRKYAQAMKSFCHLRKASSIRFYCFLCIHVTKIVVKKINARIFS